MGVERHGAPIVARPCAAPDVHGGVPSPDPELYNALVQAIHDAYHAHHHQKGEADDVHRYPLLLSMTTFSRADHGDAFMDTFAARLGSFFDVIVGILRAEVNELRSRGRPESR